MGKFLLVAGVLLVGYTVIAFFTDLPQLTDFMPIGGSEDGFYKIVSSDKIDFRPWYVLSLGVTLAVIGAYIKYAPNS